MQGKTIRQIPGYTDIRAVIYAELANFHSATTALEDDTDITADLGIDSVAVMDLLFALEERYDISIPIDQLAEVRTIGELARLVHRIIQKG